MKLKEGVLIGGIKPEIVLAAIVIEPLFEKYGVEMVATSCMDGKHSRNSKHYLGYAIDLRSRDLSSKDQQLLLIDIRAALTAEFYIDLEKDHYHLQFNGSAI